MESSEGFLTEQQREMLDIAPVNVEVLSSSPKSPTLKSPGAKSSSILLSDLHVKASGSGAGIAVRHVRRTHSGKHIRVKKDGAGGKGTWEKLLDTDVESHLDRNDPNYDSGEVSPKETRLDLMVK